MKMADFVALALQDELTPKNQEKEENDMANMRTMAFQVPEELFQKNLWRQNLFCPSESWNRAWGLFPCLRGKVP